MIGKTHLMYAAERGLMSVVEELVSHEEIDVSKRDKKGRQHSLITDRPKCDFLCNQSVARQLGHSRSDN
jgi:hypothetical protein